MVYDNEYIAYIYDDCQMVKKKKEVPVIYRLYFFQFSLVRKGPHAPYQVEVAKEKQYVGTRIVLRSQTA